MQWAGQLWSSVSLPTCYSGEKNSPDASIRARLIRRRVVRVTAVLCLLGLIVGCSNALRWSSDTHVVRPGETLYAIAWRHGLDQRDLAAWNGLGDGSLIHPGQRLRLTAPPIKRRTRPATSANRKPAPQPAGRPAAKPAPPASPVSGWRWPTPGGVIAGYGQTPKTESGIHIGGQRGQSIRATAAGQVVYSGDALPGYGQLLIIKHNADFLSAYGYNDALLVKEGDQVGAGQQIARMGQGPGRRPLLHFEIRRRGQPVNPAAYLPRR